MSAAFVAVRGTVVKPTTSGTNNFVITVATDTAVGNTLVLAAWSDVGNKITAVTDPKGNTWNVLLDSQGTGANVTLLYAKMTTPLLAGDGLTLTISAGTTHAEAALLEYSGLLTSGSVDVSAFNPGTGTSVTVGPTPASTADSELVITAAASGVNSQTLVSIPGYTNRALGLTHLYVADKIGGATGSTSSATWTWATSGTNGAVIQTFKPSGVTPPPTVTYRTVKTRLGGVLVTKPIKTKGSDWPSSSGSSDLYTDVYEGTY